MPGCWRFIGGRMNELHLFAGAGGGILGGMLLGHTTVCAVEIEPYCRKVLLQRQRDGILPKFPIWDDVRTFDGKPWRGLVDVVCGGFPCQDISIAGKGAGLDGKQSGLWKEMERIVGEVMPRFVVVENSTRLTKLGATRITASLASLGFVGCNGVLSANDVGLCHCRERIWLVANSNGVRKLQPERGEQNIRRRALHKVEAVAADAMCQRMQGLLKGVNFVEARQRGARSAEAVFNSNPLKPGTSHPQPLLRRMDDGLAYRVDRLKAIGNGQVPAVAALAWRILSQ